MRRVKILLAMLLLPLAVIAQQTDSVKEQEFDWNPVIDAIIWHESKGQAHAVNGPYVGVMQIAPILVRECNNILKARGESRRFTLNDRKSPEKSKEMFIVIMSKYNPENDIDKACRIWHGGTRYSVRKTQRFVNEIHAIMKQQVKSKNQNKDIQTNDKKNDKKNKTVTKRKKSHRNKAKQAKTKKQKK